MGNIIDYARTETRSFEALPFREADMEPRPVLPSWGS